MIKYDMLTKNQKNYLETIPKSKVVNIFPYNPLVKQTANEVIKSVNSIYPNLRVLEMGSSALEITGQNDLDIYAFSDPEKFDMFLSGLTRLFGNPLHKHKTFTEWSFVKDGFSVEFYLTSPNSKTMKEQTKVFEMLNNNPQLLRQYEQMKKKFSGKSYREYQKAKYLFYNKLLNKIDEKKYDCTPHSRKAENCNE